MSPLRPSKRTANNASDAGTFLIIEIAHTQTHRHTTYIMQRHVIITAFQLTMGMRRNGFPVLNGHTHFRRAKVSTEKEVQHLHTYASLIGISNKKRSPNGIPFRMRWLRNSQSFEHTFISTLFSTLVLALKQHRDARVRYI